MLGMGMFPAEEKGQGWKVRNQIRFLLVSFFSFVEV